MFERFDDRARKLLALANQQAQRFNHEYIGTEHIMLGLIREGSGVGINVLRKLNIDPRKIRLKLEEIIQPGPEMITMGKLPQTPQAKKVIEYAIEESRGMDHNYVGSEHLLLGLIRENNSATFQIMADMGVTLEAVKTEISQFNQEINQEKIEDLEPEPETPDPVKVSVALSTGKTEISFECPATKLMKTMQHLINSEILNR